MKLRYPLLFVLIILPMDFIVWNNNKRKNIVEVFK